MSEALFENDVLKDSLGELFPLVRDELQLGWNVKANIAAAEQARIAMANSRIDRALIEGIGQMTLQVQSDVYHYWNTKHPGCWSDDGFKAWFKSQFPETRVFSAQKAQIVRP